MMMMTLEQWIEDSYTTIEPKPSNVTVDDDFTPSPEDEYKFVRDEAVTGPDGSITVIRHLATEKGATVVLTASFK